MGDGTPSRAATVRTCEKSKESLLSLDCSSPHQSRDRQGAPLSSRISSAPGRGSDPSRARQQAVCGYVSEFLNPCTKLVQQPTLAEICRGVEIVHIQDGLLDNHWSQLGLGCVRGDFDFFDGLGFG